jgi:hypothetical protein
LDDATGNVYLKSAGTYAIVANIKGATGATGPTGPTGPSGITGVVGNFDDKAMDDFESYAVGASPTLSGGVGWSANGVVNGGSFAIVQKSISGGRTDQRLTLVNGASFGRKFMWANKWKRIRMGALLRIDAAANITSDMFFGLRSGTTNMGSSASCDNFLGAVHT